LFCYFHTVAWNRGLAVYLQGGTADHLGVIINFSEYLEDFAEYSEAFAGIGGLMLCLLGLL
jgi:hypothetical protein